MHACRHLSELAGRELFFKCELFQRAGAFKFRGACNAVMALPDDTAIRGVATQSSGNHAQAVALVARLRGLPAHVVMPENSAAPKLAAVRGYGAQITLCSNSLAAREETVARVIAATGASYIPPYNHPDVIAGQGTAGLELLAEVPQLEAIVAPVGGGGLISGLCVAAGAHPSAVRVFAAEPAGADDAARSKREGSLLLQADPRTIADGLRGSLGELTWPFVRDQVEAVITVGEVEIIDAMRLVWERMKLLIEPSSAVAVAAVLGEEFKALPGLRRVGIVLSGGNVDVSRLPWQPATAS